jgi:hypothetical protein
VNITCYVYYLPLPFINTANHGTCKSNFSTAFLSLNLEIGNNVKDGESIEFYIFHTLTFFLIYYCILLISAECASYTKTAVIT